MSAPEYTPITVSTGLVFDKGTWNGSPLESYNVWAGDNQYEIVLGYETQQSGGMFRVLMPSNLPLDEVARIAYAFIHMLNMRRSQ